MRRNCIPDRPPVVVDFGAFDRHLPAMYVLFTLTTPRRIFLVGDVRTSRIVRQSASRSQMKEVKDAR